MAIGCSRGGLLPPQKQWELTMTKRIRGVLLLTALSACGTSRSTVPARATDLPRFTFSQLSGKQVALRVLDHRANVEQSGEWIQRVTTDVTTALHGAQIRVTDTAPVTMEIRLNTLRADFELGNWNGCARLSGQIEGTGKPASAMAERCVKKANLYGYKTADNVVAMAYRDALAEMLSNLDDQLR
jgi:hypothetical protein